MVRTVGGVTVTTRQPGHVDAPPLRVLLAKVGLDGHDRGLRVVARILRDHGFEVIFAGLRQTPESIRAAVAHALQIGPDNALHLSIHNLSLTRMERHPRGWRVVCVNEMPGY